jgi:aromatic-L-amino-acid decarboxylase
MSAAAPGSLDPADWDAFSGLAHRLLDEALTYLRTVGERPVWQPVPQAVRDAFRAPLPVAGQGAEATAAEALRSILPHPTGNIHPRFFGWVHGSGTAGGLLAELLAATMNANCGGRDHGAVYVERQVIDWCRQLFDFPEDVSGLLVSGTSIANLIGLAVARHHLAGCDVRADGLAAAPRRLVGYASREAHSSVARAFEILGLGRHALRSIPIDGDQRLDVRQLELAIAADRRLGFRPFCIIGTAGTAATGAIDDLGTLADVAAEHRLWLHVDGAFGALAALCLELKPRLAGLERADSLAFDFHKWLHVQYDAGCILIRRSDVHRDAFAFHADYLQHAPRALAGGEPWFCDLGPELSRGFRALKVWFTLKEHGIRRLGEAIAANCRQAEYLAARVLERERLQLMAPVALNIVCFRVRGGGLSAAETDRLNAEIVADLQESGIAAPSTVSLPKGLAIRVNLTNHRTTQADLDLLLEAVLELRERRLAELTSAGVSAA